MTTTCSWPRSLCVDEDPLEAVGSSLSLVGSVGGCGRRRAREPAQQRAGQPTHRRPGQPAQQRARQPTHRRPGQPAQQRARQPTHRSTRSAGPATCPTADPPIRRSFHGAFRGGRAATRRRRRKRVLDFEVDDLSV